MNPNEKHRLTPSPFAKNHVLKKTQHQPVFHIAYTVPILSTLRPLPSAAKTSIVHGNPHEHRKRIFTLLHWKGSPRAMLSSVMSTYSSQHAPYEIFIFIALNTPILTKVKTAGRWTATAVVFFEEQRQIRISKRQKPGILFFFVTIYIWYMPDAMPFIQRVALLLG